MSVLFGVPACFQTVEFLAFVGDFLVEVVETFLGAFIKLVFRFLRGGIVFRITKQVRFFHLETVDLTLQFVDFLRRGVEFHAQVRCGLVNQIDGFVRQLTAGNIPVRQRRRGHERIVSDGHLVVGFVFRCDATQDGDGVFHARLSYEHLLETAFQCRILFDVLTVFVECGGTDQAQFASREHGFEHVARVHGSFGRARADDGMDLIDERDDLPVRVLDFLQHALQAFLELATVFRTRHHGAQIKRDELLVLQGGRHIAGDDTLREAFHHGGFAHARLADQHRIVLGAAAQDLDDSADFLIAADHGIELAFFRGCRQVGRILFEGFVGAFGVGTGHFRASSDRWHGFA